MKESQVQEVFSGRLSVLEVLIIVFSELFFFDWLDRNGLTTIIPKISRVLAEEITWADTTNA